MGSKSFRQIGTLGLYTETSLHCGAESGTGYVDLPVQRERHTNYPVIPGSTVKGVLRDELAGKQGVDIDKVFGSPDAKTPGSVAFGDAVLVAFPIRSSGAPFHWVTCPFALDRVYRMLGLVYEEKSPAKGEAWGKTPGAEVLLEEIIVRKVARPNLYSPGEKGLVERLDGLFPPDERGFKYTRAVFPERLLVVTDDDFGELVETGTEVVTRIKLNGLGTTRNLKPGELENEFKDGDRKGNMFVQELVPAETLFAAPVRAADDPRLPWPQVSVIRLGGNETIGHGVTHLTWRPCFSPKRG